LAYIGNIPAESYASFETETFSVSATTNYTLSHAVTNENEIRLVINGVVQQPGSGKAYTASGTTLTLTSATVSGDVMYAVYLGRALQTVNPPNASVGISQLSATGTKDATTFLRGDNTFAAASGAFESALVHIQDQKSAGTNGGSAGDNATVTRDLNTVLTNEVTGASLGSNQVTLPSGTYYINGSAPASHCNSHQVFWYNVTDSSEVLTGKNTYNSTAGDAESTTHSFVNGRFTIAAQKVFELRHRVNSQSDNIGLGREYGGSNSPPHETYGEVIIWKTA
jgi:hypothetical protein